METVCPPGLSRKFVSDGADLGQPVPRSTAGHGAFSSRLQPKHSTWLNNKRQQMVYGMNYRNQDCKGSAHGEQMKALTHQAK